MNLSQKKRNQLKKTMEEAEEEELMRNNYRRTA